jgi:glycosyltransferase involved in cell wall biosynthesis
LSQRTLVLAVPGDPTQRTGGYIYDAQLAAGLRARGWRVRPLRLPDGYPFPVDRERRAAAAALATLEDGALVLVDGLAFGAMAEIAATERERLRLVGLCHHPLGLETGLDPAMAAALLASERAALQAARAVLVTSAATRRTLRAQPFALVDRPIGVAPPGVAPRPLARGSGAATVAILAVASVIPRKGFRALIEALAPLADLPWQLTIAGSLARHPSEPAALRAALAAAGLTGRAELAGELDEPGLAAAYARADLFVSAAAYEGFGMALADALACGLPVVAVAGGAVADWLDPAAALLVPPDDPAALRASLARAIGDGALRAALRHGAIAVRARLPTWADTAAAAEQLLAAVR